METDNHQQLLSILQGQHRNVRSSLQRLQLLASGLVFSTIAIAFIHPAVSTSVFISLLAFWLLQVFASRECAQLAAVSRRIRLLLGGACFPQKDAAPTWPVAAGLAVYHTFGFLLLIFDASWLSHAYLHPTPASSFHQFLQQLRIGPLSGEFFVWFTILLWIAYAYFFVIGYLYAGDVFWPKENRSYGEGQPKSGTASEIWIGVQTSDGAEIFLQGSRFVNPGRQPLILFPGFFQNGFVYDLEKGTSLATFLWKNGFDCWIIHPRGTAQSEGRKQKTSLDDMASDDIPAVIEHVLQKTKLPPVFVGHSQGGISGIISLLGVTQKNGTVEISDREKSKRQSNLKGLVTLGSFLDFTFSKPSALKRFVNEGWHIQIGGKKWKLLQATTMLKVAQKFNYLCTPLSFPLRLRLLQNKILPVILFPVTLMFNLMAQLPVWEFLYHRSNVEKRQRKFLFYKTMDGTFSPILKQFFGAVATNAMSSVNGAINYSALYSRIELPVSVVAMELDTLADPVMMQSAMFAKFSSVKKYFTVWKGVGHEDHFANASYFPQVLAAIKKVCDDEP